jgi:predicted oxidoreductase (fatty acid repression mutant protein)
MAMGKSTILILDDFPMYKHLQVNFPSYQPHLQMISQRKTAAANALIPGG